MPPTTLRRALLLLLSAAAAVALGSCGDAEDNVFVNLGMKDNFFTREVTRVAVGDTVRFANSGDSLHNAVPVEDDAPWRAPRQGGPDDADGNGLLDPGQSMRLTFEEPGVYEFYCTLHGTPEGDGMFAALVVGDADYVAADEAPPSEPVTEWTGITRRVGGDGPHPTIQDAVDAAEPGDLVLVEPGIYREEVKVTTPYVTIRGVDRQEVVIDGEGRIPNAISVFAADGVAIENLTVRNATENGVFITDVTGYRVSHVTAYDNHVYGLYAFDARDGLFEGSYASGSPDAGFYIGQCDPCDAAIRDSLAEWNGLGYSGTNASGDVWLIDSVWRHNHAGIVPNTLDSELLPPAHDVVIAGNLVHDNGNPDAPALTDQFVADGNGIVLAGVRDSLVTRNLVANHAGVGIAVAPLLDVNFWMPGGNTVRGNTVEGSGQADLALTGPGLGGDCFADNVHRRTVPPGLEAFQGCGDGLRLPFRWELANFLHLAGRLAASSSLDFPINMDGSTGPPPAQPPLPGGADAPVRPAVDVFAGLDLSVEDLRAPEPPADLELTQTKEPSVFAIPLAAGFWSVFFGLYGYLLPFVLLAAWTALALWDLARRDDLGRGATLGWVAVLLLVPFLGPIVYHLASRSPIPAHLRLGMVLGGLLAYVVVLAIGAVVGGVV